MQNKIAKSFKLAAVGLTFLFGASTVQAATMPIPDHDFLTLVSGTHSASMFLPDSNPNVLWFQFELSTTSIVNLDTVGSIDSANSVADTVLALYDSQGSVLGQNDDCGDLLTSCLMFGSLGADTYLAGVTRFPGNFIADWILVDSTNGDEGITLNVTVGAVPVPAAIWLFGTALIGFVGISRKRRMV